MARAVKVMDRSPALAIVRLTASHLDQVQALVAEVVKTMRGEGIDQWDELYPTRDVLEADVAQREAFGAFVGEVLVGYVCLNAIASPEYAAVAWTTSPHALIIHRLCAIPVEGTRGVGQRLLAFAENFAVDQGFEAIRLDAFSKNPRALALYERNEYALVGHVRFRKGEFVTYEKPVSAIRTNRRRLPNELWPRALAFFRSRPDVNAVLLVGSYARGTNRPDSDVDLVVVTKQPQRLLEDLSWIVDVGEASAPVLESWGAVTSIRVWIEGAEVEFGITGESWLATPLDAGTRRVLTDGFVVMAQRGRRLDGLDLAP